MQYQAVIFDLDGTLLDTLEDLGDSVNAVLEYYGYPMHTMEAYRLMIGNGIKMLMRRSFPEPVSDSLIEEALNRFKVTYEERFLNKTHPYAGILMLIAALQERKIPMAICTNKHQDAAQKLVQKLLPVDVFSFVYGERVGVARKPDPAAVLEIAQRMGITPSKAIYVGDSMVDMQTAVNAGMLPVGVLWGFRDRIELEEYGGKVILSHPMELLDKVSFVE